MISENDGRFLLALARRTIEKTVKNKLPEKPQNYSASLDESRGVFCTINKIKKELRGCIGIPYPVMSIIDSTISAAQSVCSDPRFPPLQANELKEIKIELSILTEPKTILWREILEKIQPHKDGVIIEYGPYSGLYLPQVWEHFPNKEDFLDNLCLKAGLGKGMWRNSKLSLFQVQIFKE